MNASNTMNDTAIMHPSTPKINDRLGPFDNVPLTATAAPGAPTRPPALPFSRATQMLLGVASRSPLLCRKMGIVVGEDESLTFPPHPRAWLTPNQGRTELNFDPDRFHREMGVWSTGEHHMGTFLLNVWNPSYAKQKKWLFNLFDAVGTLAGSNDLDAIIAWMQLPVWP